MAWRMITNRKRTVPRDAHLDTVTTVGVHIVEFSVDATLDKGYPWPSMAGTVEVTPWRDQEIMQYYHALFGGKVARRQRYRNKWGPWTEIIFQPVGV